MKLFKFNSVLFALLLTVFMSCSKDDIAEQPEAITDQTVAVGPVTAAEAKAADVIII